MKFLLDENISHTHVSLLNQLGHDAVSVINLGLAGADDFLIKQAAETNSRILVTLDLDFVHITHSALIPSTGVVLIRLKYPTESAITNCLKRLASLNQTIDSCICIIDSENIRIRKLL